MLKPRRKRRLLDRSASPRRRTRAVSIGGIIKFHEAFHSTFLHIERTLAVYLPPGYADQPELRYPVFYLHDGQNLFDPGSAAYGVSWQAHATADRLIHARRIPPLILVGIYNTPNRMSEYTMHLDAARGIGGSGQLYGRFLFEEVKPFIDGAYRTFPGQSFTAVGGSSLGGLISLELVREFREFFAMCGALSPSLWWAKGQFLKELESDSAWLKGTRYWLDMGTKEGPKKADWQAHIDRTRTLTDQFDAAGMLPGHDYYYWEVAGGEHNEAAWGGRFAKVLLYFFGRGNDLSTRE